MSQLALDLGARSAGAAGALGVIAATVGNGLALIVGLPGFLGQSGSRSFTILPEVEKFLFELIAAPTERLDLSGQGQHGSRVTGLTGEPDS